MYRDHLPLSAQLNQAHAEAWQTISAPGDFFTGAQRLEMVRISRQSIDCKLCKARKSALSPNAISGEHDGNASLSDTIVEMIHRIRTDPGRLTKSWFNHTTQTISKQAYVEIVSVVTSAVIIDTLHNSLGQGVPSLPLSIRGRVGKNFNQDAVEAGAWVPLLAAGADTTDTDGLPEVPNIIRALGLVPSAVALFFGTFRPHYALKDIQLSISQSQAEFVAARVSAMNECFY